MNEKEIGLEEDFGPDIIEVPKEKREPAYRVMGARIPVGKGVGTLWHERFRVAKKHAERYFQIAENIHGYYQNTLDNNRASTFGEGSGNSHMRRDLRQRVTYVENMIFANAQALMPHLYTQNPTVSVISNAVGPEETDQTAKAVERLVNTLASKKGDRGLSLRNKVRRCILAAHLFNEAYIEVGYTNKETANDAAREDLDKLAQELEKAKTDKEVEEIEAKIATIEQQYDFLTPPGPWARYRRYDEVLVDPAAVEEDLSDARYVMIADFISTAQLQTMYGKKHRDGTYKSVFKPTHILAAGEAADSDAMVSLVDDTDYKKHGFQDQETYERCQYTRVWRVWDKTTRRVYMFNEASWEWPIFVWDDPYKLDSFFSIERLWLIVDPHGGRAKPEPAYILDQQDMIDQKNSYRAKSVEWATNKIVYNKNIVSKQDVDKLLSSSSIERAMGLDIPEGMKMSDVLGTVLPPAAAMPDLFDTQPELAAIERISAVSDVLRGGQFKTNTTNKAVQSYSDVISARSSDRRDQIEDFVGRVLWKVAQLCLQFMPQDDVMALIGQALGQFWINLSAEEIQSKLNLEVIGGSTTKPTSSAKKQEVVEVGQVLGQFAQIPEVVVVLMQALRRAYSDSFLFEDTDWQMIMDRVLQASGQEGQGDESAAVLEAIVQKIDALPPEQKVALGEALAKGVSMKEVIATLAQGDGNADGQQQPA
jgi:hypothetical protein